VLRRVIRDALRLQPIPLRALRRPARSVQRNSRKILVLRRVINAPQLCRP
jgi:hypothetical protein